MIKKKTLVIGGSPNPIRYSNKAIRKLISYGHDVVSIGLRESEVGSVKVQIGRPLFTDIHTVTMYIGPAKQSDYFDYIISLKPKRIVFNPGTENLEFENIAINTGIEVIQHCTLVMLNDGMY
mgnify:CR=1 FL=1